MKNSVYRLQGKVQHYQWGGDSFLPLLLRIPNPDHQPFAEYWLGAHNNAPSEMVMEKKTKLNEYIAENPPVLGNTVEQTFGRLPYLFKVLDVKDMLSIQVHPSKKSAELEFDKENKAGVPLNAANRNYKDDNHKPELMVALGDFYLLHGFRSPEKIRSILSSIPAFHEMLSLFENEDYKKLYSFCMEMEQQQVNTILQPLLDQIIPAYKEDRLLKDEPHFWAARAALTFNETGKTDRGIFSVYLLNLLHLTEGEAIFQDAGVLHAYLEGQNMEIMANSDNVLRGGLTPKYIDVAELMNHVRFDATIPEIIHGTRVNSYEDIYRSPAKDFELSRFSFQAGNHLIVSAVTAEIFIVMHGSVQFRSEDGSILALQKGESAVVFADVTAELTGLDDSTVFRATVPVSA